MTPQIDSTGPEVIGPYKVHPVASLFPLMEGEAFEELKQSLRDYGQQEPIVVHNGVLIDGVVHDNVLLDGRNRERACLELGIEPRIVPYTGKIPIEDFILNANLHRRHLTDDQRIMIVTGALRIKEAEAAKARQIEGGKRGKEGGRGHRKTLAANSTQGFRAPTTTQKIAAAANGTDHQARQALAVAQHAPELVDEVKTGRIPLKDAVKQIPPKPQAAETVSAEQDRYDRAYRKAERAFDYLLSVVKECPLGWERKQWAWKARDLAANVSEVAWDLADPEEADAEDEENN